MTSTTTAQYPVPLHNLEKRLERLEFILKGGIDSTNTTEGMRAKLQKISETVSKMQKESAEMNEFFDKYEKVRPILDSSHQYTLSTATKYTLLLLSGEDFIKDTAKGLQFVQDNEKFINSERFQSVPTLVKKLAPLQVTHQNQLEELGTQSQQLEQLLNTYNNIIHLLSEKFAFWDAMLTKWEQDPRIRDKQ